MIRTLLRVHWLNLKRDRVALGLTFVLPIVFFSVFGFIYSNMGHSATQKIETIVVDEDGSEASGRFVKALKQETGLEIMTAPAKTPDRPWTRESGINQVRTGEAPVALVIPHGFGARFGSWVGDGVPIEMYYDESNPVAPQMVTGLMQKAAMTTTPDLMITRGLESFEKYAGPMTDHQRQAMEQFLPQLRQEVERSEPAGGSKDGSKDDAKTAAGSFAGPVQVKAVSVFSEDQQQRSSLIAYSAAGIGVMFLLFSMSGAGGTMLEEQEQGTLERVLSSSVGMSRLLLAKWLFIALMGVLQVTLMFIWGALVFRLDLFTAKHLAGFAIMTVITAMAAAGFGMMLATACRSRNQLGGVSTIVILLMSALGGSMIPSMFMPKVVQQAALATFNGWALEGYRKVFWYSIATDSFAESLLRLWPQVTVLGAATIVFMAVARRLARRWESA